jgi:dimethylargininase
VNVTRALVRGVPESFAECELTWIEREAPNVALARAQHEAYVAAIEASGVEIVRVPPDSAHPDCTFVEDVVLELGHLRVLTHPGATSRRGERPAIAAVIGEHIAMPEHLHLDGGDVIRLGERVWVGESTRTQTEAIDWLREVSGLDVRGVRLNKVLHLKTAATLLDERTLLCWEGSIDESLFQDFEIVHCDGPNILRLPDRVLTRSGTGTAELARARGHKAVELDISQFTLAEASLTCMSVLLED